MNTFNLETQISISQYKTNKNEIRTIYNKYKSWALQVMDRYSKQNFPELLNILQSLPKITDPHLTFNGKLKIANVIIDNLDTWNVQMEF